MIPKNDADWRRPRSSPRFPAGTDIPDSKNRVKMYTDQIQKTWGVEIVNSIEELLPKVDVVLLEASMAGRTWPRRRRC